MEYDMDPYEEQLLRVFNSYDRTQCGQLDRDGLVQLCNSLQLEEQGFELIKCLLDESKSHVTFPEFKEGLLALLGNVQNNRQKLDCDKSSESESESPDREISPKFVYGSKKYGRRSRPETSEQIEMFEEKRADVFVENKSLKNINKVQRSNSQSDVTHSRKRKTSGKLKRCTSFPGNHDMERQFGKEPKSRVAATASECNEQTVRAALEHLELGRDGYLSQHEVVQLCEYVGLHKLAKQLAARPDPKRVTVDELVNALRKDTADPTNVWDEGAATVGPGGDVTCGGRAHVTFGPLGSGAAPARALHELWEAACVPAPGALLSSLGFRGSSVPVAELAAALDDELREGGAHPAPALLQASLALHQCELKYVRAALDQLAAERDKLRADIADANHRASLLAQEIDDSHANMERTTQHQVRLLEHKHADALKELQMQHAADKEQLGALNAQLERRVSNLEQEEAKVRASLATLHEYNQSLEKENSTLGARLRDLEAQRTALAEEVANLQAECQRMGDVERERDQLQPALERLRHLQVENAELRDKNDELCSQLEGLVARLGDGDSQPTRPEVLMDALGESGFEAELDALDSSLSLTGSDATDEATNLVTRVAQLEQLPLPHSIPLPPVTTHPVNEEIDEVKGGLVRRCKELESLLEEVQRTFSRIMDAKVDVKEKHEILNPISILSDKLRGMALERDSVDDSWSSISTTVVAPRVDSCTEIDDTLLPNMQKENEELRERCNDLEQALEMLRSEYENCENYWANKLDEERHLFEVEQRQSSEKLTELLNKMTEYEEQFAMQDNNGRLSPIEEKDNLEQQFTELEEEYEEFKSKMESTLELKEKEIQDLQLQLNVFEKLKSDVSIQTNLLLKNVSLESKTSNLSNVIQSTNIFSAETLPNAWQYSVDEPSQLDSIESSISINNYNSLTETTNLWQKSESGGNSEESTASSLLESGPTNVRTETLSYSSLPPNISWQCPAIPAQGSQPHSLNHLADITEIKSTQTAPGRPRKPRKTDRVILAPPTKAHKKELVGKNTNENCMNAQNRWNGPAGEQSCVVPMSSIRNLHRRLRELDTHCKHLQFVLKQQQKHSENLMHHCWQQHRDEVNELQEKLTRADKLIKELYVENTYLMANNQHLEHRCHILVQCNSESTSV